MSATLSPASSKPFMLRVRLSPQENERLEAMLGSEMAVAGNKSEFIRLLLHREWNRRKGTGRPDAKDWMTDFRVGRPKQPKGTV